MLLEEVKDPDSLRMRFWRHVDTSGPHWLWLRSKSLAGYGQLNVTLCSGKKKPMPAHRVAFLLTHGYLTPGLFVLHGCDIPLCCRPSCLKEGTQAENMQEMHQRGRRGNTYARGSLQGQARYTEAQVLSMREEYVAGATLRALAERYGSGISHISQIVNGTSWAHVGGPRITDEERARRQRFRGQQPKLTDAQVREILNTYAQGGVTHAELAARYGVHGATIGNLMLGISYRHIPRERVVGHARLTPEQVQQMREQYATGAVSFRALGRKYGVVGDTARDAVLGLRKPYTS